MGILAIKMPDPGRIDRLLVAANIERPVRAVVVRIAGTTGSSAPSTGFLRRVRAADRGNCDTGRFGEPFEHQRGLALPSPHDLLLTGAINVLTHNGGAGREAVLEDGQCRGAGQSV